MFEKGKIVAYPTNTSYGLGVFANDPSTLQEMYDLKERLPGKFFSLMVRDLEMLKEFAEVPTEVTTDFFTEKPRTAILKPSKNLPKSIFWPEEKVAFRICTKTEIAKHILYPITATSANKSGEPSIFSEEKIKSTFGKKVLCFPTKKILRKVDPSEIWDYTTTPPKRLR